MAKLGKRYRLSSDDSLKTKSFYDSLKSYEPEGVKIENIREDYNNETGYYQGKIVINGPTEFLRELLIFAQELTGTTNDLIFDIDTHYEELLELKGIKTRTAISGSESLVSLANSLDLYKFKSPLEYNFLVRNYENYLNTNPNIQETALPYFYEVLADFVATENVEGFGTTFFETPASVITSSFRNELITSIVPYQITESNGSLRIDKYLQKYNIYKEQFPFYTDISFDTHQLKDKSLTEAINNKNLFSQLLNTGISNNLDKRLIYDPPLEKNTNQIFLKEINVDTFLTNVLNNIDSDFTFIFDINQRVNDKARDFSEILSGSAEYSEVMGYHLKKFDGSTNSFIQDWYLPNVSNATMTWVDSQIKYDKAYTYKLDPIVLTFSTEYRFTDVIIDDKKRLIITFINRPLIKGYIFKNVESTSNVTLGAEYTNRLLDYPPLDPEIELVPYIGVDNKIKLNFNTSTGLKTVPSIDFSSNEKVQKDKLRLAQNKDVNNSLLTFQTDEPADYIEIYKIEDDKPSNYQEFFDKKLATLSTNKSSGASFIDNIKPNKKYYYIARCIDYHGNISNPTSMYELEIINDNGLIIPAINLVEFDKKENLKQSSKDFKRFLKIQPALRHRLVNNEKTNQNAVELGVDKITPWNKRFKLRLISKSTGKKIDVNFKFKYNKPE